MWFHFLLSKKHSSITGAYDIGMVLVECKFSGDINENRTHGIALLPKLMPTFFASELHIWSTWSKCDHMVFPFKPYSFLL
jgi:hypothetical protein